MMTRAFALVLAVTVPVPVPASAEVVPTFVPGPPAQLILHDTACDLAAGCADVSLSCPRPGDYAITINGLPLDAMKAWMTDGLELTAIGLNVPPGGLAFDRIERSDADGQWSATFGFSPDDDFLIDSYASEIAVHAPHTEISAAITPQSEGEVRKLEAICSADPEGRG